ncbi:hypothetical protein MKQ68_05445 [Chitinophaga horti]|uniref:Uncharacterized protein n=1 Tax=Chitinophaga horti TaxID=2920382 RepID=A0ABY6J4D0_9BACT|nr:hypothetical protein [Chitinophaga horti]UYQ94534.1 hypothetical protein MKQ68_05445 [Chitinophaga horti]
MMQTMSDHNQKIPFDFRPEDMIPAVRSFEPVLYRQGNLYYCLLGADADNGILGFGATPRQAIADWEHKLRSNMNK